MVWCGGSNRVTRVHDNDVIHPVSLLGDVFSGVLKNLQEKARCSQLQTDTCYSARACMWTCVCVCARARTCVCVCMQVCACAKDQIEPRVVIPSRHARWKIFFGTVNLGWVLGLGVGGWGLGVRFALNNEARI